MYVVCVTFRIHPGQTEAFYPLVLAQAATSLREEPGCHRFDVCSDGGPNTEIFLYELYQDAAAFDHHLETAHFRQFDRESADMVAEKRVKTYNRMQGGD